MDANDAMMSVDIKVRKIQEEGNEILIYKPINVISQEQPQLDKEKFCLAIMNEARENLLETKGNNVIMVDSTHGMNQYGFQLTTIMVNDYNHKGFPVAIVFSTSVDIATLKAFFTEVKKRVPDLKPQVFMTDDDKVFYSA